jgi:hypothetical protein
MSKEIVNSAVDRICKDQPKYLEEIKEENINKCEDLVRKTISLGLNEKEVLADASSTGLSEMVGKEIADCVHSRQDEIRLCQRIILHR